MAAMVIYMIVKYRMRINNKFFFLYVLFSVVILINSYAFVGRELLFLDNDIDDYKNLLFLFSCLSVAVFEELLFRVFIFNFIYESLKEKYNLFRIVLITSLLFGFAHFTNFLNSDYETLSVINQILLAFGLGTLLQSLYIRLRSIIPVVLIHTWLNYFGMYKNKLVPQKVNKSVEILETTSAWSEFVSTFVSISIIIILVIIPLSYLLIKNCRISR